MRNTPPFAERGHCLQRYSPPRPKSRALQEARANIEPYVYSSRIVFYSPAKRVYRTQSTQ